MIVQKVLLAFRKRTDVNDPVCATPIRSNDGLCATGEMMSSPEFSKLMKPLSNKWSIEGVRSSPLSPFSLSSFVASRQGFRWLARR